MSDSSLCWRLHIGVDAKLAFGICIKNVPVFSTSVTTELVMLQYGSCRLARYFRITVDSYMANRVMPLRELISKSLHSHSGRPGDRPTYMRRKRQYQKEQKTQFLSSLRCRSKSCQSRRRICRAAGTTNSVFNVQ